MAVAIEHTNVILRKAALDARFPGASKRLAKRAPRGSVEDAHLTRLAFESVDDARTLIAELEGQGLREGEIALVSSDDPYVAPVWLEVGLVDGTLCCWLRDEQPGSVAR